MAISYAVFGPDQLKTLQKIHASTVLALPLPERTASVQAKLAEFILQSAAQGEWDPVKLRTSALTRYKSEQIQKAPFEFAEHDSSPAGISDCA